MQYVVLKSISPHEGPIIEPAPAPTAENPEPQPVLLDAAFFSGETDEERAANIERLIAQGVIAPVEAAVVPEPITPEPLVVTRRPAQPQE